VRSLGAEDPKLACAHASMALSFPERRLVLRHLLLQIGIFVPQLIVGSFQVAQLALKDDETLTQPLGSNHSAKSGGTITPAD